MAFVAGELRAVPGAGGHLRPEGCRGGARQLAGESGIQAEKKHARQAG